MTLRLIVDEQLPVELARALTKAGIEASHVINLIGPEAPDHRIWTYAAENNWSIISKDADFLKIQQSTTSSVALIWIPLGNCRNDFLIERMINQLPAIIQLLECGETLIAVE